MSNKLTTNKLLTRYALTGGAIGLYFGFFFRPAREPNLWFVLVLGSLVTVVTVAVQAWRKRPLFSQLLKTAALTFVRACLFLVLLELRHPIYDFGGKFAVTIFMTVMGAVAGLWYAYEQIRQKRSS